MKKILILASLCLSLFASALSAAIPRLAFFTQGGEFDPSPEIRAAAAPWIDRMAVDIYPSGTSSVRLGDAAVIVVDATADLAPEAREAIATARAARTRIFTVNDPAVPDGELDLYFKTVSTENFRRLVAYLATRVLQLEPPSALDVTAGAIAPVVYPLQAIYHPDAPAPGFFTRLDAYQTWYRARHPQEDAPPVVGLSFHRSFFLRENVAHVDALIRAAEVRGAGVVALMSQGSPDYTALLSADGKSAVDVLLFIGERISIARKGDGLSQLRALGVPVLSTFQHFSLTAADYAKNPGGLAPSLTGVLTDHERDGLFEPLLVSVKSDATQAGRPKTMVIPAQIEWRMDRALAWAKLRRAPNASRHLVFTYWSEGAGKANVGGDPDDFLDVPGSLAELLPALKKRGYDVGPDPLPTRDELSARMSREASNVGTWAPGELAGRIRSGAVELLPVETYMAWFDQLPRERREEIIAAWGPVPGKIMIHTDEVGKKHFVFPRLQFGHVTLAAHPDWGYLQDESVLLSKDAVPPHHQYLAFFLWMQHEARASAWVSLFSNIVLQPGKSEGPAASDHIALLLGATPHIHPEKMGGNGGLSNKRKALALTPGWFNAVVPSDALKSLGELAARLRRMNGMTDALQRADGIAAVREEALRLNLGRELGLDITAAPGEALVEKIRAHLVRLERDSMPNGSHVLGQAPGDIALADMVSLMLAPELRPLLPADLGDTAYRALISDIVLKKTEPALIPPKFRMLARDYAGRLRAAPREITSILDALEGSWIEPGPFDEPLRTPDALPPGRVLYGFDQRIIPTPEAEVSGRRQAEALIAAHREKHGGSYPQKLAYVLWSSGIAKTGGAGEAAVLYLLGTRVTRDARGNVSGVELIPRGELGRPRIDVLMTTSGTYRDHFQDKVDLITRAVQLAAASPEPDNPIAAAVAERTRELIAAGETEGRATQLASARVFSPAPGAYSPAIQFLAKSGDARGSDDAISDLYVRRLSHAYGGGLYGDYQRPLFEKNLGKVDGATLPRGGMVNGILDDPMPAAFLGGLGQAVKKVSGREADLYTTNLRDMASPTVETVAASIARELRTRYFNPKFIEALQARGYDGARYPMFLAENLDLWDTTTPDAVESSDWGRLKSVYVDDEFGLGLADFFQKHNPFARQMIMANLLQASARGHWQASAADLADLAQKLAESARDNGLVCEANVCRNAALTGLIEKSLTGVPAAAELMQAYRGAMEKVQSLPPAQLPAADVSPTASVPPDAAPASVQINPLEAPLPTIEGRVLEDKFPRSAPSSAQARSVPWLWLGLVGAALALLALGWVRAGASRVPQR